MSIAPFPASILNAAIGAVFHVASLDTAFVMLAISTASTFGYPGVLLGPAAIGAVSHVTSLDTAFVMLACLVLAEGLIAAFVYHRLGGEV